MNGDPVPRDSDGFGSRCLDPDRPVTSSDQPAKGPQPVLRRLTLNVANVCNLACKYCYANGGTYYSRASTMDEVTALSAVNYARRHFSRIDHVSFFGGEPTLNPRIIRIVCEYFAYLSARGIINHVPRFGLTTNGYSLSEETVRMLVSYDFSVSFSLDGPSKIHDRLRVTQHGAPTWSVIAENIDKVRAAGIVPEFECTYTAEHLKCDITVVDLLNYFYCRFDCRVLHCPIVIAAPDSPWFVPLEIASELYADAIRESVRNVASGVSKSISSALRMMQAVAGTRSIFYYCPAGAATITVNPDGNVYACSMLMAGPASAIGNVNNNQASIVCNPVLRLLETADKWRNGECCRCWAQPLCFGCIGEDLARGCRRELCDYKRKQINVFLDALVEHLPSIQCVSALSQHSTC